MNVYSLTVAALLAVSAAPQEPADRIQEVQVRDNRRVRAEAIKNAIRSRAGGLLDAQTIAQDVRAVYALAQFDDVYVEEEQGDRGKIIVFYVTEKPLIRSVVYEGLKSVAQSDVLKALNDNKASLSQQSAFDRAKVGRAVQVIRSLLEEKGRRHATITVATERVPPNSVIVTLQVDEGPKIKIGRIDIEGNHAFTDTAIKRAMKLVKEAGPLTAFTGKDAYHEGKLRADIGDIRTLYAEQGYIRVNVLEPVVEEKSITIARTLPFIKPGVPWGIPLPFARKQSNRVYIKLALEENEQYRVGEVTITGATVFPPALLKLGLGMNTGEIYNETLLRKSFEQLKTLYGRAGYINFTASPQHTFDEEQKRVHLTVDVNEDKRFSVNRISFSGNKTTRDKVIRRQLFVDEGAVFNSQAWDLSRLRLNQLGYFEEIREEDVQVTPRATEPEVDITLKVQEKSRNSVGFNGGAGSAGSYIGFSYETNNFIGLGETLAANVNLGTRQTQFELSFTEPYLVDRPIATGFTLFSTSYRYDQAREVYGLDPDNLPTELGLDDRLNFEQERKGFGLSVSHPAGAWSRLGIAYRSDTSNTAAINPATRAFFSTLASQEQEGNTVDVTGTLSGYAARRITPSFTYSTVNSPYNPSQGYSLASTLEFVGGFLGGNVNFYRPTLEIKAFREVGRRRNVLATRFLVSYLQGFTNTNPPFYERSFIGGDFNIRGFETGSISPMAFVTRTIETLDVVQLRFRDVVYDDVTYVGGDTQAVFNLEYRVPVAGPFTLAPFVDIGNTWVLKDTALRRYMTDGAGNVRREDVRFVPGTNSGIRSSAGLELQFVLPVLNQPFRLIFAVNPNRIDRTYTGPVAHTPFAIREPWHSFRFAVGKTF